MSSAWTCRGCGTENAARAARLPPLSISRDLPFKMRLRLSRRWNEREFA